MPTPTPDTTTKPDVGTPVRSDPAPIEEPDRFYNPERLCPDQSKDGGWRSRP